MLSSGEPASEYPSGMRLWMRPVVAVVLGWAVERVVVRAVGDGRAEGREFVVDEVVRRDVVLFSSCWF